VFLRGGRLKKTTKTFCKRLNISIIQIQSRLTSSFVGL
jgi:hypothetical protein